MTFCDGFQQVLLGQARALILILRRRHQDSHFRTITNTDSIGVNVQRIARDFSVR